MIYEIIVLLECKALEKLNSNKQAKKGKKWPLM